MAVQIQLFANTVTVGTTEVSVTAGGTTIQTQTVTGAFALVLDVSAMAAGDEYEIAVYEKAILGGTQRREVLANLIGAQANPIWTSDHRELGAGWDFALKKIAGTDRSLSWSVRAITGAAFITSVSPAMGNDRGGTAITIAGAGFTGFTAGTINGVALTSFTVVNDATITAVTGAQTFGTRGLKDLIITKGSLTYALASGFEVLDAQSFGVTPVAWWRADRGITQATGVVSQWDEIVGGDTNKNAVQATSTKRPVYNASVAGFNNRPTMTFDGTDDFFATGTWTAAQACPFTVVAVAKQAAATDGKSVCQSAASGCYVRARNNAGNGGPNTSLYAWNAGAADAFTTSGSAVDWQSGARICTVEYATATGGTSTGYVNRHNTSYCGNTNAGTLSITAMAIGGSIAGAGTWNGDIAELIIYPGTLTAANRQKLMANYLGDAYGVTVTA